ncbi:hypothetical protein GCWU000282_02309 [Catonella morbi ATCC 51271]|uniref:D-alanine--D-alanine ligase N-terminal domain-containing protein n=1 Tax=Catonella morbi ATCC 51271 TaxID=592026 RepID=V2Z5I6_9FIRM|nr:hypothetical protein GCWU000282_02309 [Catonella morbi ATCC 51271]
MDAYFGKEFMDGELFSEEYDTEQAAAWMRSQSSGFEELMKTRKEFFGPHVLEICQKADIVFLALHGANGEDGKVQSV